MFSSSIVRQATDAARHALLWSFAGGAAILCVFVGERFLFQDQQADAIERAMRAQSATGQILLADERLTMSANMAAATGERRWIERYEDNIPLIDGAIAEAKVLAPSEAVQRFDQETRASNDRLVEIERRSFDEVRAGRLAEARALLDGAPYASNKQVLSRGTARFSGAAVSAARDQLNVVESRAFLLFALAALVAVTGAVFLWRELSRHLRRSEAAFLSAEERIRDLATNDALTGVANRRALSEYLSKALDAAQPVTGKLAVLMIDLDHFKAINDKHGHVAGDLVLKEVAQRMLQSLREGQLLARYDADEFVAVVDYEGGEDVVRRLASRIIERVSLPVTFGDLSLQVGASIGVALSPVHGMLDDDLLRKAEIAVRSAKTEGRGVCRMFDASMDVAVDAKKALREELRAAVKDGELAAYFQPVVNLAENAVSGFEILCRWRHPSRGILLPETFIPLAEEAGFTNALTMSVLRSACNGARSLPPHMFLALNVSPQQIQDEWLVEKILRVLTETGMAPGRIEIELTESALVSDLAAAKRVITSLKNVGMSVSLDDFGTGYSSLCYLSELPFDKIKIDRSFIHTLSERDESAKIVNAIVGLGRSLGVPIVAEGVETALDAEFLKDIGCSSAQGYYYARPMDAAELGKFLETTTLKVAPPASDAIPARARPRQNGRAADVEAVRVSRR
jgi:diguanylate cyclase (GGDEF)-like protein